MRIGFRHCDPRFPFLWQSPLQPAARWHGRDEGPAKYFADTPVGAWAEFLRHEGITDEADLAGVQRSLWAAELPDGGYASPALPETTLFGDESSYPICQAEARRLRVAGAELLEVRGAALQPGQARGWTATAGVVAATTAPRDGKVTVLCGACECVGWVCVDGGQPPAAVLPLVRHLPYRRTVAHPAKPHRAYKTRQSRQSN